MLPFPISANPAHTTPGIWVTELNGGDHAGSAPLFLIFIPPLHFSKLSGNFRQSTLTSLLHSPCCSAHRLLWLAGVLVLHSVPGTRQEHVCRLLCYLPSERPHIVLVLHVEPLVLTASWHHVPLPAGLPTPTLDVTVTQTMHYTVLCLWTSTSTACVCASAPLHKSED